MSHRPLLIGDRVVPIEGRLRRNNNDDGDNEIIVVGRHMLHRPSIHDNADDSDVDVDLDIPQSPRQRPIHHSRTSTHLFDTSIASSCDSILTRSQPSSCVPNVIPSAISSLLDIAAKQVGRTYTCEMLERCDPPLDNPLLRKVAFWAFPTDAAKVKAYAHLSDLFRIWSRAKNLVKDNRVREMWQVGFMATAYIMKHNGDDDSMSDIRVSLRFERQRILSSTCSECKTDMWCSHVLAAVIYRIHYPDRVCVHAPMTEALSTLNRDQLQKLLQYAICEDPAGILGKVFKHIDAVSDNKSDVNTKAGIPDPTFGGFEVSTSDWQMSLNVFEERLIKNLISLSSDRSLSAVDKYYPATYDKTKKQTSYMNWFTQRVVELVRSKEYFGAATVLITILRHTTDFMNGQVAQENMKHYFHDLCRFYAITMMYIQDKDPKAWEMLQTAVEALNSLSIPEAYKMRMSQWAELPSLASLFPGLEENSLFYEPIAACSLYPTGTAFYRLLNHQPTSPYCCHLEDISIVFAQLEGFVKFGDLTNKPSDVINLLLHVLTHLCKEAQKFSLIGDYISCLINDPDLQTQDAFVQAAGKQQSNEVKQTGQTSAFSPIKTRAKRKSDSCLTELPNIKKSKSSMDACIKGRQRRGPSKGKHPARLVPTGTIRSLNKGQLVYCITYCCYLLVNIEKKADIEIHPRELLCTYMILALELGYFRTWSPEKEITQTEQECLQSLEQYLSSYFLDFVSLDTSAVHTYIVCFNQHGLDFYDTAYPLVLLDTLCYKISLSHDHRDRWCSDVIRMLAGLLKRLPSLMDKNMVVSKLKTVKGSSDYTVENLIVEKTSSLTSIFLSFIQQGNNFHEDLVTEVLNNFKQSTSITALTNLVHDVTVKLCGMVCGPKLLKTVAEFVLHTQKSSSVSPSATNNTTLRDLLRSLFRKLGLSSLDLIPDNWMDIFPPSVICDLILIFESDIQQMEEPPQKVVDIILAAAASSDQSVKAVCRLVFLFKVGSDNHKKAVANMLKKSDNPTLLIEIAKQIWEQKDIEACMNRDSDCMKLIEAALQNVGQLESEYFEQVDWLCEIATKNSSADISTSVLYQLIISHFAQFTKDRPDILVRVLSNLAKAGKQWLENAKQVKEALVPAYVEYFSVSGVNLSHSRYGSFVNKIFKARQDCVRYVENGGARFDTDVIGRVRQQHQKKKKLMNMLMEKLPLQE